jgi:hypothetical protein
MELPNITKNGEVRCAFCEKEATRMVLVGKIVKPICAFHESSVNFYESLAGK